jgi:hypothetical protein
MTEQNIPPAVAMEFKQTENESFETWLLRERARLNYLAGIVGRPARTFDQKKKLENARLAGEKMEHVRRP